MVRGENDPLRLAGGRVWAAYRMNCALWRIKVDIPSRKHLGCETESAVRRTPVSRKPLGGANRPSRLVQRLRLSLSFTYNIRHDRKKSRLRCAFAFPRHVPLPLRMGPLPQLRRMIHGSPVRPATDACGSQCRTYTPLPCDTTMRTPCEIKTVARMLARYTCSPSSSVNVSYNSSPKSQLSR